MKLPAAFFLLLSSTATVRAASAGELSCTLAGRGLIRIDGLLADWANMPEMTAGTRGSGFTVRCAYDDAHLYVMVDVMDDRLIRSKHRSYNDDFLTFRFGGATLEVFPAAAELGARLEFGWAGKSGGHLPRPTVADSLQKRGWSVEMSLPLRGLPGYEKGAPGVPLRIDFHDANSFTEKS